MTHHEETVKFYIDGRQIEAPRGTKLLDAAKSNGFYVPTLCHHGEVSRYGSCRLCMMEVTKGARSRVVASCDYDVAGGITVLTATDKVTKIRKLVLELLWARCPEAEEVVALAKEFGVAEPRFPLDDDKGKCILCGLCIRACKEVVGASALGFHHRGGKRSMGTPYKLPSRCCIGCGTCVTICPTGQIEMFEENGKRIIWDTEFEMQECASCGRYFAPKAQLEYLSKVTKLPVAHFSVCTSCK